VARARDHDGTLAQRVDDGVLKVSRAGTWGRLGKADHLGALVRGEADALGVCRGGLPDHRQDPRLRRDPEEARTIAS
jgi:hypothetical protein